MSTILNLSNVESGVFPIILVQNLLRKKGKTETDILKFTYDACFCEHYDDLVRLIESYGITVIGKELEKE